MLTLHLSECQGVTSKRLLSERMTSSDGQGSSRNSHGVWLPCELTSGDRAGRLSMSLQLPHVTCSHPKSNSQKAAPGPLGCARTLRGRRQAGPRVHAEDKNTGVGLGKWPVGWGAWGQARPTPEFRSEVLQTRLHVAAIEEPRLAGVWGAGDGRRPAGVTHPVLGRQRGGSARQGPPGLSSTPSNQVSSVPFLDRKSSVEPLLVQRLEAEGDLPALPAGAQWPWAVAAFCWPQLCVHRALP